MIWDSSNAPVWEQNLRLRLWRDPVLAQIRREEYFKKRMQDASRMHFVIETEKATEQFDRLCKHLGIVRCTDEAYAVFEKRLALALLVSEEEGWVKIGDPQLQQKIKQEQIRVNAAKQQ